MNDMSGLLCLFHWSTHSCWPSTSGANFSIVIEYVVVVVVVVLAFFSLQTVRTGYKIEEVESLRVFAITRKSRLQVLFLSRKRKIHEEK